MNALIPVLILLGGAALGAIIAALIFKTKANRAFEDGKADSATQLAAFTERLAAKENELAKLQQAFDKEASQTDRLEGERRAAQERSESFKQAAEALSEKFKALSRDALKDNNQEFLNLARATLEKFQTTAKGELEQRQQ